MMHGYEDDTLTRARQRLHARLDEGLFCPCCDQYAKRYRRKMNSGMVRSLINIYRNGYQDSLEWVYIPNLSAKSREGGQDRLLGPAGGAARAARGRWPRRLVARHAEWRGLHHAWSADTQARHRLQRRVRRL